jgi:hypothetical protein
VPHHVALISAEGMDGWIGHSILRRSDIVVHHTMDCDHALQIVLREDCQLAILEEWEGCTAFQRFLSELLFSINKQNFRVILITNSMAPGKGTMPIAEILPRPCDPNAFDRAIVRALGIGERAGKRHLVRIHLSGSSKDEMNLGLAVCVVLNSGGMLVESPKPLPEGKVFFWSFQGVQDLKGLRIQGRILRKAPPEGEARGACYAVAFDEDAVQEKTRIALYLNQFA